MPEQQPDSWKAIGLRLRELRHGKGVTQRALAAELGIHQGTVSLAERGSFISARTAQLYDGYFDTGGAVAGRVRRLVGPGTPAGTTAATPPDSQPVSGAAGPGTPLPARPYPTGDIPPGVQALLDSSSLRTDGARRMQSHTPDAVAASMRHRAAAFDNEGDPPAGADIWVDFGDVNPDGTTDSYADMARPGLGLAPGTQLVAGDHGGNTAQAVVAEIQPRPGPARVVLRLDMATFTPAPRDPGGGP